MRRWETIRSGSQDVSPFEVDEALLLHPDVEEAVTFPVPDAKFGESVASAVVIRAGAQIGAKDLKWFAYTHLASHKIPQRIIVLDSIPRVERRNMARALRIEPVQFSARVSKIKGGMGAPLFVIGAGDDFKSNSLRPVYAIREPEFAQLPPPHTVEHVAAECIHAMRRIRPTGPFVLGATNESRDVAFEMARQLELSAERVEFVAIYRSSAPPRELRYDRRHLWAGRTVDGGLARV